MILWQTTVLVCSLTKPKCKQIAICDIKNDEVFNYKYIMYNKQNI